MSGQSQAVTERPIRALRIEAIRRRVETHRECCADKDWYRVIARALNAYDGQPPAWPSQMAADVLVAFTEPGHDARLARYLHQAIAGREVQP